MDKGSVFVLLISIMGKQFYLGITRAFSVGRKTGIPIVFHSFSLRLVSQTLPLPQKDSAN